MIAFELGDLEAEASWLDGQLSGDITAADIMAHDLSSLHLGTSDTILMSWNDGEILKMPYMSKSSNVISLLVYARTLPAF